MTGACLLLTRVGPGRWDVALFLAAAVFVPARLLSNMFDGMVAIEGGRRTPTGDLFNELPDRASDLIVLLCAGYSVVALDYAAELGWTAAVLALITAYVRTLGAAVGATQWFTGPMAKQQRMIVVAIACLVSAVEVAVGRDPIALAIAMLVIVMGCAITIVRRIRGIARELGGP